MILAKDRSSDHVPSGGSGKQFAHLSLRGIDQLIVIQLAERASDGRQLIADLVRSERSAGELMERPAWEEEQSRSLVRRWAGQLNDHLAQTLDLGDMREIRVACQQPFRQQLQELPIR